MNVLFLLTPKKNVLFLTLDMSVEAALDLLKNVRYSSVPLLDKDGHYVGTITEGDLLWHLETGENRAKDIKVLLKDIRRYRDYKVATIDTSLDDLFIVAINQNYIPITDDRGFFIGIITRKEIITYYNTLLKEYKGVKYNSDNPGLDVLMRRRSIRQFKDEKIEEAVIDSLIEAGLTAPSARNRRPIHIMFSDNKKLFAQLGSESPSFTVLSKAPYAFFIFGDKVQEDNEFLLNNDASAVTTNILNAITSFNLGGVWLGAAKLEENDTLIRRYLKIEDRYRLFAIIAFGVANEIKEPHPNLDHERAHKNNW